MYRVLLKTSGNVEMECLVFYCVRIQLMSYMRDIQNIFLLQIFVPLNVVFCKKKIPSEMGVAPPNKRFSQFSAVIKL